MSPRRIILLVTALVTLGAWSLYGQPLPVAAAAALGTALWTRFSMRLSGSYLSGVVTGALAAISSAGFVASASLDFNAAILLVSGLLLNFAEALARRDSIRPADAAALGVLAAAQSYLPRLSLVYAISAVLFFLSLSSPVRRRLYVPGKSELYRGKLNRALTWSVSIAIFLSFMAFLTSDEFLGINAEANLKVTLLLGLAIVLKHRWRPALENATNFALGAATYSAVALTAHLVKWQPPGRPDDPSGLVRWSDIAALLSQVPARIGANFSHHEPMTYGLGAALAAALALVLGWFGDKRERYVPLLAQLGLALAAWFGLHGHAHLAQRDFFVVLYPLYAALGFAAARSRLKAAVLALSAPTLLCGLFDLYKTLILK